MLLLLALLFLPFHLMAPAPSVPSGDPVPNLTLPGFDGLTENGAAVPGFSAADFFGNVTVVNVFASWCRPCLDERPFLALLDDDDRIVTIGIVMGDRDADALAFLAAHGNPFDAIGVDANRRASIAWGAYGVPGTFVVDRNGMIRYKLVGPMYDANFDTVVAQIDAILAEQPAPASTPPP